MNSISLGVPVASVSRKLSLQPPGQQQPLTPKIVDDQGCIISQPPYVSSGSSISSSNNFQSLNNGSCINLNSLTVINNRLAPRKSVIGRLERASFQAQRLSDVGVAFGQQITAKIGLKLPASQERIVEQTRWLYLRYLFAKLRQNSLPLRDLNLTKSSRARRAAALGETPVVTSSAPATALPSTNPLTPLTDKIGRKRTAKSGEIDKQDLSLLSARLYALNLKNESLIESYNESNSIHNSLQSFFSVSPAIDCSSLVTNRKYVMDTTINNQVFIVIVKIIRELRDMKSEYYGDTIYELIGIDKFSSIQNLLEVQMTICQEMIRSEITWCRIVALFSLFGAMSLDCVRMGTPEHVGPILDGFIEFVERDLASWISQQGGWESFLYKYRGGSRFRQLTYKIIAIALPIFVLILLTMSRWEV